MKARLRFSPLRDSLGRPLSLRDLVRFTDDAGQLAFATVVRLLPKDDPANSTGFPAVALVQDGNLHRHLRPARLVTLSLDINKDE